MVLRPRFVGAIAGLAFAASLLTPGAKADEGPRPGQVTLELKDYLSLVDAAERAQRERAERVANRTEALAQVSSQRTELVLREGVAEIKADFEVLVQGHPKAALALPAHMVPESSRVEALGGAAAVKGAAPGAVLHGEKGGLVLLPLAPGRYAVHLTGAASLAQNGAVRRYVFAPVAAPVAVTEIDLPADLVWSAPGAVVVEERVEGARRKVRLSAKQGETPAFEVRRRLDGGDAEKLLAKAVVLTLFQLGPEGAQRHDVILYEVARGSLSSLTVDLPPGLEVDKVGTDEGEVVPVGEAQRLTVHRRRQLQSSGYMVLTSTPDPKGDLTLAPLVPGVEVRARYLAVSSTIASEAQPAPEADWSRVDLEDLPPVIRSALSDLAPTAAWRWNGKPGEAAEPRLRVAQVQPAPLVPAVVRKRETTTVLTVDGTVLHRDLLSLYPVSGVAAALDLQLPAGGTLWSVKVDDQPVRPLEKNGRITIPLGFNEGTGPRVEVVSVLEKAVPKGRSALDLDLPRVAAPVQEHLWRLLLPAGASYRFARGDLRPVPVRLDRVTKRQTSAFVSGAGGVTGTTMSAFEGRVRDDQGSALPGVTLLLSGEGAPQAVISDANGEFHFRTLAPGNYSLKAELEGFSSVDLPVVSLSPGRITTAEVNLSAAVEDLITVTGEAGAADRDAGPIARLRAKRAAGRKDEPAKPQPTSVDGVLVTDMAALGVEPGYYDFDAFEEMRLEVAGLKNGLVGGVRSLPITVPENGKVFVMAGLLPPERVAVELDVKGQR